ncbi:hypothetical protein AB1Y20_008755 [Prymnesium parvum]|uniref:Uncharacterized protein n=1 Tax=Prymnesium parvum TaxID=97485 RepID=A0AB34IR89_PRYPA
MFNANEGPLFVAPAWTRPGREGRATAPSLSVEGLHGVLSSLPSVPERSRDGESPAAERRDSSCCVPECLSEGSFAQDALGATTRTEDLDDSSDDDECDSPKLHWAPSTRRRVLRGPRLTMLSGG